MPIVISITTPTVVSALQVLTTVAVYDYEYTPDNLPLANAEVSVWLAQAQASVGNPALLLESKRQRVWTDMNGFWQLSLVPNLMITPAGTYYVVRTPQRTYRVAIPGGTGPFQASANPAP